MLDIRWCVLPWGFNGKGVALRAPNFNDRFWCTCEKRLPYYNVEEFENEERRVHKRFLTHKTEIFVIVFCRITNITLQTEAKLFDQHYYRLTVVSNIQLHRRCDFTSSLIMELNKIDQ